MHLLAIFNEVVQADIQLQAEREENSISTP
jgi:hypothetical protein